MMIFYFVGGKLFQVFLRINSQVLTKTKRKTDTAAEQTLCLRCIKIENAYERKFIKNYITKN